MRFLHTSDIHLGRQFNGLSLEEDHAAILDQILDALIAEKVELLIIAGDIFDRAVPPASAVKQFNAFLKRVANETEAAIALIGGNHDSGERINAMSILTDTRRALVRGGVEAEEPPLLLQDEHGPIAVSALPFSYEHAAQECFEDPEITSPEDVLVAQLDAARAAVPEGARWVVLAHAFVAGGQSSEGERALTRVGGIEHVSPKVFDGAHYVALGHLHRPQQAGAPHIRYSGSPLAFGFDEAGAEKSMVLGDLKADGSVETTLLPYRPMRAVRVITGEIAAVLAQPSSDDIVQVELHDTAPVIDAMKRVREIFPNACDLIYARPAQRQTAEGRATLDTAKLTPTDVMNAFLEAVRQEPLSDAESTVLQTALDALREEEARA